MNEIFTRIIIKLFSSVTEIYSLHLHLQELCLWGTESMTFTSHPSYLKVGIVTPPWVNGAEEQLH